MLMHFEAFLLIATNIVALFIMLIIAFARTVDRGLRVSAIVTIFSLLFWQNTIYLADHLDKHLTFWNSLVFLWPIIAVGSFFLFIWFLHSRVTSERRFLVVLAWIVGLGITIQFIALFSLRIFDAVIYRNGAYEFIRGSGYYVYLIGLVIGFIAVITALVVSTVQSLKNSREQRALKIVLWTVICAIIYGVIANVLIPVILRTQVFISIGIITVDIFAVGFGLSVIRGKLLDVRFYVIRTVAYILSLVTLAGIYAAIVFIVSHVLLSQSLMEQGLVNVALILVLAFVFQPIKDFFDKVTNRLFYRDNYSSSEFLSELGRVLSRTTDLRSLLERASRLAADTLKAEQAFFTIYYGKDYFMTAGTQHHSKLPIDDIRLLDEFAKGHQGMVITSDLLKDNRIISRMFVSHKVALVLVLYKNDTLIGYMFLGEQRSRGYTDRDMRMIGSMADELVIAIQNALSVQEVRELNNTLQQRIDSATKELRESNNQLRRLDEAKDEFVSMASHQLRTPLTSVKGYISMLLEGDGGKINDTQKHFLGEAFTSSERMVHLINDFLNVSRLQTGKFVIDRHAVDLAKIAAQEVDSLRMTASQRQLTLKLKVQGEIPVLFLDESKIRQVIMNFIDNALYYSAPETTILIELKKEAGDIVLTVKDTGIGVPATEQAHLFTKFYRASNARKQRPDGTGVGLFLAKKVIVSHGGQVVFESSEGKGSTFGFRLPIARLDRAPASDADNLDN